MSARTIGRIVGACYLLAFVFYLAGGALVGAASGSADMLSGVLDATMPLSAGALLMLVNSVIAGVNGVLVFSLLRSRRPVSASAYLTARTIEVVVLAVGILFLLLLIPLAQEYAAAGDRASVFPALARVAEQGNYYAFHLGMLGVCAAMLVFCHAMLRERLVPAFLAVWGLGAYVLFLVGTVAELLGYKVALATSIPGGLFEVALGILLIVKGFPARPETGQGMESASAGARRDARQAG
ncbi:hypothetical protein Aple_056090 [Acrocarpospora pleiomorpha]|uniref:DUF4386 domain-containing protein n=1 Tax=Acrocarpospora pleiomorpha TaxID=90975 RepID=A0A5M3XT62_9ACTN|nr:DUF4386 domain-containing protein [Acrocarpospora pleiomorpha]GES22711.1 hypothetical protein Aple_056090 [Acrocarpospora pleiomorpha]